jgi:protein TonB
VIDPRRPALRHLVGAVAMLVGTSAVFGLMLVLNATAKLPDEEPGKEIVAFEVKTPPPPPNRPKPKPKRTPPKRSAAPPPPSGLLAAGVGGLDFGLGDAGGWGAMGEELLGEVNQTVMTDEAVDEQPRPLTQSAPEYPRRARAQGIAGRVVLSFLIDRDGAVQDVRVLSAEPPGWFEEAAQEAVRSWSFEPARYQGAPVPVRREIPLEFDLQ